MAKIVFHLDEELSIFVYVISAWLFLRAYTSKSSSYGIGIEYSEGKIFNGIEQSL
jgi:hypothetical protein